MFHKTKDNKYVNLAHVLHVAVEKAPIDSDGSQRFDITFHLTTGATVSDWGFGPYLRLSSTMIAAEPGYFALDTMPGEDGKLTVFRSPVVGWTRDEGGIVLPLCAYSMRIDYMTPILQPDGRVLTSDGTYVESEADWLASIQNPRILRRV